MVEVENDRYLDLARRYATAVAANDDPREPFVARATEFPFIAGAGDTPEEAIRVLTEMVADAIEDLEREGEPIPEPLYTFTGMLHLRVPKSLHQAVARRAAIEGVSLNATAIMLLTHALAGEATTRPKS